MSTLFGYNARGEQDTVAVDLDGNGQIDLAGSDRVTHMSKKERLHPVLTTLRSHHRVLGNLVVSRSDHRFDHSCLLQGTMLVDKTQLLHALTHLFVLMLLVGPG